MKIKLSMVRLSFPVLFEAEKFKGEEKSEPRYSAAFIVERGSENDKAIQAGIQAVAAEAWPKKTAEMLASFKGHSGKMCYVSGDLKTYDGYQGMNILSSHRKQKDLRPLVLGPDVDPATGELRRLTPEDGKPYAGCYVNASVELWAQVKDYPGIRCTLLGVQFAGDGDAFSGVAKPSQDDFDMIEEGANAESLV